ncbi:DUF3575 domain-containing protein [Paludibacter jiangxiensis]|uniref:DUF3575 domain-containing protein n=1 Tax=Paludibacter jiangxiensis TaxID=681398 RepID=A0A161LXG9_9BACT|nr:DUF3575 domain-containing protein [Paludibacter jiangxiensis]GAT64222.1 hypothetical protein PJIAN_4772 [Paludibacter jiangxiensis]
MKTKLILGVLILMFSQSAFGQRNDFSVDQQNNEVRMNFLMAIAGMPEINYERYLSDNMGVGMAMAFSIVKVGDMTDRFSALPYCRIYFGETKRAAGFFIEGNMALVHQKENGFSGYYYNNEFVLTNVTYTSTCLGFGAAVGFKLLTRGGVSGELYLGAGRLFGDPINAAYPRCGICIGKRF